MEMPVSAVFADVRMRDAELNPSETKKPLWREGRLVQSDCAEKDSFRMR